MGCAHSGAAASAPRLCVQRIALGVQRSAFSVRPRHLIDGALDELVERLAVDVVEALEIQARLADFVLAEALEQLGVLLEAVGQVEREVLLCRPQLCVAKQLPDDFDIGVIPEQEARKGVPEPVGAEPRRTEADFLAHMQAVVASDPTARQWHVVLDNLDIHRSE
ncbi:MAG: hypothetical protein RLZZ387_3755, partial [Chloroflexota bacterium]